MPKFFLTEPFVPKVFLIKAICVQSFEEKTVRDQSFSLVQNYLCPKAAAEESSGAALTGEKKLDHPHPLHTPGVPGRSH